MNHLVLGNRPAELGAPLRIGQSDVIGGRCIPNRRPGNAIARAHQHLGHVGEGLALLQTRLFRDATIRQNDVDVASLRAEVGDPTARWVAEDLPRALAEALARVGRAGAPVTVRIDTVIRPSSGGQGLLGSSPDQILGEVIVGGVARPLRASTSYHSMAVDQALVEQSNRDRVSQLAQAFAYWAAREV